MIDYFKPFLSKQGIRVIEIHSLLRRGGEYSSSEIMQAISQSDGCNNGNYSLRTFREDIHFLKEFLEAPIHVSNRGIYKYLKSFSLFPNFGLIDQDIEILENLSSAAGKYSALPFFNELNQLIKKIKPNHKKIEVVGFEGAPIPFGGIEHFEDVFWSIQQNRILEIDYNRFGKKPIRALIHPYYLKEYNHRWYVLAWAPQLDAWRTYALDRIDVVHEHEENSFSKRKNFNPVNFWQHSVGIITFDEAPTEFSFEVKNGKSFNNIDYLRTMPIHHSQTITATKTDYVRIDLLVYPTIELFREIRQLGQNNTRYFKPKKYEKLIWED